jgi:site-specific DNA-methyltransferase (adenine-specific)
MICPCCGKHKRPENLDALGTALKPAMELIALARKPLSEKTVAANVLRWGVGALNIDGCRVPAGDKAQFPAGVVSETEAVFGGGDGRYANRPRTADATPSARWPANLIHDGSDEVVGAFPESNGAVGMTQHGSGTNSVYGKFDRTELSTGGNGVRDSGSAARFFYSAKADADDRLGSSHPTVKPVDLMQYLVRLVTPKGGTVLDPFAGTGTTGEAAIREGCKAILIEREPEYLADIERRCSLILAGPDERRHATLKAKGKVEDAGPLFAGDAA